MCEIVVYSYLMSTKNPFNIFPKSENDAQQISTTDFSSQGGKKVLAGQVSNQPSVISHGWSYSEL